MSQHTQTVLPEMSSRHGIDLTQLRAETDFINEVKAFKQMPGSPITDDLETLKQQDSYFEKFAESHIAKLNKLGLMIDKLMAENKRLKAENNKYWAEEQQRMGYLDDSDDETPEHWKIIQCDGCGGCNSP